jgi:diadenosine tetraphosphate (Ap4A) HIT family hydrolase
MALIFETNNFHVEAPEKPLVDRGDGGHIVINPKVRVTNRQQLSPKLAIELMRLTLLTGQAMTTVMNANGVDVGRINYQDNGNWTVFHPEGSFLHIHLYGRAKSAQYNKYGQACFFPHKNEAPGYYERFSPLHQKDIFDLTIEITRLSQLAQYSDSEWGL